MATLQELKDKRLSLWEGMKNILDTRATETGDLSVEDTAEYDRMEKEFDAVEKNIARFERNALIDAKLSKPAGKPILNNPNEGVTFKVSASDEYRKAAVTALRTNFRTISNYLQEGVDADGGYLVPDEWDSRLITALEEENIFRTLGTTITTSGERKINIAGQKAAASWIDEGASLVFTDTSFSQVTLDAHKLQVGVKVTNELLYDNKYDLEGYLIDQFSKALSNAEEDAFLNGAATDTTKPTGLFVTAAADTDNVVVTATTDTKITADDIVDLVYKLKRPYRKNAVFVMNDAIVAQIRKLKDNNQAFIWQPSMTVGEPDTVFGYKVYTSAYAPAAVSGNAVIAFGDMSYYNIADRGSRTFRELREVFMPNDMTGFLMIERVDGALILPEAVRVLKLK